MIDYLLAYICMLFLSIWIIVGSMVLAVSQEVIPLDNCDDYFLKYSSLIFFSWIELDCVFSFEFV